MKTVTTTKVDQWHCNGYFTFWDLATTRYHIVRPKKYCVLFSTWKDYADSFSCTEFNTLEDALEEAKILNKVYSDTPKPQMIISKTGKNSIKKNYNTIKFDWDFSDGRKYWGYVVLDMINCKFIKVVNGIKTKIYNIPIKPTLKDIDLFFRGDNEIPEDYAWDIRGEYEGWLQFRWGDGKNALDYVEEPKNERPGHDEFVDMYNPETDSYIKKKVRVVDVAWDDPLPKREKGIYYRRPNKEPVKFPGEFGYDNDYSMWPWALSEEIAEDEYVDSGNTLDKKETTSSIGDILGEDNPLLKLKFD